MNLSHIFGLVIVICACCALNANAQKSANTKSTPNSWAANLLDYKHDMLVKEMEFADEESKNAFLALYTAMEKEMYQANKEARDMESKVSKDKNATDADYQAAAVTLSGVKMREAEIEANYFAKFEKILTKKQLFIMKSAEIRFSRSIMRQGRQRSTPKR